MKEILFFLFSLVSADSVKAIEVLPDQPRFPTDNPSSPEKIILGRQLFFDPRISKTGRTACASCHNLSASGENNLSNALLPNGKFSRHAVPTIWNAAFLSSHFWTGGATSLEEQAEGSIEEMGLGDTTEVVKRVQAIPGYQEQLEKIFSDEPNPVNLKNITRAIATYERSLTTPDSPVDRFLKGDASALSASAQRGIKLFQNIGCATCHNGPNFAGQNVEFGNFAKFPKYKFEEYESAYHFSDDLGRFRITQNEADKNMWRIAPLRNIEITAPYFHNGSVKTLNEAVQVMARSQLNIRLSQNEIDDISCFLRGLTGVQAKQDIPTLPPLPSLDQFPASSDANE